MKKSEKKINRIKVYNEHNLPTTHYNNFKDLQGDLKVILDENLEKLKKSIIEFGVFVPNFVWKNKGELYIMDGHQRRKAFISLETEGYVDDETGEIIKYKIPEIPYLTINAKNKKDAGKKLLQLNSKYGSINNETIFFEEFKIDMSYIDDIEIPELEDLNFDLDDDLDFDDKDLDDGEIDENAESVCRSGDLWKLGKHRLMCGDAIKQEDVEHLMNKKKADMVFTDPPYGVDYDGGHASDNRREKLSGDDSPNLYEPSLEILYKFTKSFVPIYLFYADGNGVIVNTIMNAIINTKFIIRNNLIWNKNHAQFGALSAQYKHKHESFYYIHKKGKSPNWYGTTNEVTVWDIKRASVNEYHPTQKPVKLISKALKNSSKQNDIILDLFGGSGSTLMACEQLGRKCYMMEINEHYCDVILKRYLDYTGIEPIREDDKTYNELRD